MKTVDAFMSTSTIFVFMTLMEICLVNIILGDAGTSTKVDKTQKKRKGKRYAISENYKVFNLVKELDHGSDFHLF